MRILFEHIWEPPVFPGDEAKTQSAQTLHQLLLGYLAVVGLACVLAFFIFASKVAGLALALAFLTPTLAALAIMRSGRVMAASLITVAGGWIIITVYVILSGGMTSAAMVFYLACTTFAGLLLGNRAAVIVASLSSLTGLALVVLSAAGYFPPRLFPMPPQSGWMDLTFSLYLITVTLNVTLKNLRETLAAARQQLVQRQIAEEALGESERKFRDIARNIPGMVFQYRVQSDGSGHFSYVSPRATEQFGLTIDLQGQVCELEGHLHPEDRAGFSQSISEAFTRRADWHYEGRLRLPDGGFKWFEGIASPAPVGDDVLFNGLLLDITERKRAEADLRESEMTFRTFINAIPLPAFLLDRSGRFLAANEVMHKEFESQSASLVGQPAFDLLPPTLAQSRKMYFDQVLQTGAPLHFEDDRATDSFINYMSPVVEPDGQVSKVAVFVLDITERKNAEEMLRQLNSELEQRVTDRTARLNQTNAELARALRAKDEFLATMNHELRSPLNTILLAVETLDEGVYGDLSPEQRARLRVIEESGQHLLALINDILDLAKYTAGKVELALEPVIADKACQAALRLIQERALKKRLRVSTEFDPRVGVIQADGRRLKQILVNLLTNAVKFTPEGGEIGLIVSGHEGIRTVSFTVWDSGVGIAAEDLPQLFQPFVQIDNPLAQEQTGTGLGLALVKSLATLHGGSVSVDSTVNQGSRFTVSLPWAQPATESPMAPAAKAQLPSPGDGQLILLAEDSELAIPLVAGYLQMRGYRLVVARNGQEALDLALETRPALILMDIQMPKMNGMVAMRHLRGRPETAHIPIIALTALSMPGDQEACLAAGANDYLAKPVSLLSLLEKITALVGPLRSVEAARPGL